MKSKNLWARRAGRLLGALVVLGASGLSLADITLESTFTGPADYTPGGSGELVIAIVNSGDMEETGVRVSTAFPDGATVTGATCVAVGNGTSCNRRIQAGELDTNASTIDPANGSITYTLRVEFAADMAFPALEATATINSSDDTQDSVVNLSQPVALKRVSDLSLTKTSTDSTYTPGSAGSFTLVVTNDGPSDATGVTGLVLTDTAPAGMTIGNWSCTPQAQCPVNSGNGNIGETLAIAAGDTLTYALDVSFDSSLQTDPLVNIASLDVPAALNDPDVSDHSDQASLTRDAQADLSLAFPADAPTEYVPGTSGQAISFSIGNAGPSDAFGANLALAWTDAVSQVSWTCSPVSACTPASGNGDVSASVDIAQGDTVTLNATLDFDSGARADLVLEPSISATDASDGNNADNTDSLTLAVDRRADLQVTKTANVTSVNPGASFIYEIEIENLGPSDVGPDPASVSEEIGLLLTDIFQPGLLGDLDECRNTDLPCWKVCAADNGVSGDYVDEQATCPTTLVTGNISESDRPSNIDDLAIALAAGSTTTLRAFVRSSTGSSGEISNSASVRLNDGVDAQVVENTSGGGSDSSQITLPIELSTDIAVTKTDGTTTAVPGEPHSYTIEVENKGFISANNVAVFDELPLFDAAAFPGAADNAGFIPGSVTWQCEAFGSACCNANSSNCGAGGTPTSPVLADILDNAVSLDGQGRVVFTISGQLDPRASGTLVNQASATLEPGVDDPNLDNNTASDSTDLVPQGGLTVEKTLQSLTGVNDLAPFTLVYSIVIANSGPSFVAGADVSDPLDASVFGSTRSEAEWTCSVVGDNPGQTACASASGLGPLQTSVDLDPGGSVAFSLTVSTSDLATGEVRNDVSVSSSAGAASDFEVTSLIGEAELTVAKTDNRASIAPGQQVDYLIRIDNEGPDDVFGARVADNFPDVIDSLTWSCRATTPIPGDLGFRLLAGAVDTAGDALVASTDGRHVYVVGNSADSLFAYSRTNTPGTNFGDVVLLETEINGINDGGDSGPAVSGMNGPIDIVISPDGRNVYVLSLDAEDGPSLAAFGRSTNPAAPDFGELTFLGSTTGGVPLVPATLTLDNERIYIAGRGDPDAVDAEGDPVVDDSELIAIFDRDGLTGVPIHDFAQLDNVPAATDSLAIDLAEGLLLAGGQRLAMFTIDPAQGGLPAGRLSFVTDLAVGSGIGELALAVDAPHVYGKSVDGGTARLVMLAYLDSDGNPALEQRFTNTAAEMTLPAGTGDPLAGLGGIAIAPDGEHLAGVSIDQNALYTFRRDPISGGLTFAEAFVFVNSANDPNRGLRGAADVVFAADGRHLLIAASAEAEVTNPPLTVYSRRAPDPLFAFVEVERNTDSGNAGLLAPNDVATSPDGAHVYAVSLPDNALVRFNRFPRLGLDDDSLGMHLQFDSVWFNGIDGVQGLLEPRRILISPDGKNVFVTSEEHNTLAVFSRDNDPDSDGFGALSYLQTLTQNIGGVDGLAGAQGMAMQPVPGTPHLYVAGSFGSSIARFVRNPDGTLGFASVVVGGVDGVSGLSGIRDLAVTADGRQLLGVSTLSNALVVFDRQADSNPAPGSPAFGDLTFVQAQLSSIGARPVSLAISGDGAHVYVAGQNSDTLAVLRRVTNSASSAFGQVQPLDVLTSGSGGIEFMNGPRDVLVSPDGKRIYVAAEFSNAVLVFDRDLNSAGARFGFASLVETRRDSVRGVDGLRQVRALAISKDSRNVYAAGFGDAAIASFRLGVGSVCTAGGSGNIDDRVDIGVGGTIVYRATGIVRPDAFGEMVNVASVSLPPTFRAENAQADCPVVPRGEDSAGIFEAADFCDSDTTTLVPDGRVSVSKESDGVSVTAGELARYTIRINNAGPSSLIHEPGFPLTVSDRLDDNPDFVPGSAVWTCRAEGSGNLGFIQAWRNFDPEDNTSGPFDGLAGVSGMTLVPASTGNWLASASVLDDSISIFSRDPVTGDLAAQLTLRSGDTLDNQLVETLDGARAIAASHDGRFLYVASRVSDAITVLSLTESPGGDPVLGYVQSITGLVGLDQVGHLVLSPDAQQNHVYAAGANDNAIAIFSRDDASGELVWVDSVQQGIDSVSGLTDVGHLLASPDGRQLYALSPTSASVALFDRDPVGGGLTWRRAYDALDLGVGMDGVATAAFDSTGQFMYLSAQLENRLLVLERDTGATASAGELVLRSTVEQGVDGVNGLVGPGRLAVTGDGVHLYVLSESASTIAWFVRDSGDGSLVFGGLRGNQGGEVSGLGGASGLVIDDTLGQVLVAGTMEAAISQFQRQADSFCPASGSGQLVDVPFNIGAGGSVTFSIEVEVAGDASGVVENIAMVEAARDSQNMTQSSVDSSVVSAEADLAITKDDGLSEIDGLAGAASIAGNNRHIYTAAPGDNALGVFERNVSPGNASHGLLDFVEFQRAGKDGVEGINGVVDVALSADGGQVYAASPVDNSLSTFDRDPLTGRLSFAGIEQNGVFGVSGISGATALALSSDDSHVYVAGGFANAVATFTRQVDPGAPDFGRLSFVEFDQSGVDGVAGIAEPVALTVSPDGLNVYVIGAEADTLAVFGRNRTQTSANFGRLSYITHYTNNSGGVAGLEGVADVVVSADGRFVYVLGDATGTLARFERDSTTGELAFIDFKQDGTAGTTGLTGARSMLLDDAGDSLYVAAAADSAVLRFDVDADSGALDFAERIGNGDSAALTGGEVFGLEGVSALALADDGDHLYAASSGRDAVLAFQRPAGLVTLEFQQILIDGLGGVAPGVAVEYVIGVENLGPSDVAEARVTDQFPEAFESVQWTCSAQQGSGAQCLAGGLGDLDTLVSLPAGGRITIRASGIVSAGATGRLVNTATVSAVDVSDPRLFNNSATDDDTVLSPAVDLMVSVDNGVDGVTPGDLVAWDVIVANAGPSSARGVFVEDIFAPAVYQSTWSCRAEPAAGILLDPVTTDIRETPAALAISADGRFAYVAGGDEVEVLRRDPLSGSLTLLQRVVQGQDSVNGIRGAADVALSADGRFVYVAGADSDAVVLFARDTSSGELDFIGAWQDGLASVEGLGGVARLLLSPQGDYLYAAGLLDSAIAIFEIDGNNGQLAQTGLLTQGINEVDGLNGLSDLAWAENGNVLLAVAAANQSLTAFERNASTGALALVSILLNDDLLGGLAEGALLGPVAVLESGDEIIVAARDSDRLGRFELQPADPEIAEDLPRLAALGLIDEAAVGVPLTAPLDLQFDPDQARLYVATADGLLLLNLLGEQPAVLEQYDAASFPALLGLSALELSPGLVQLYTLGTQMDADVAAWTRERGSRCPLEGAGRLGRQQVDIVAGGQLVYRIGGAIQANASGELSYTVSVENPVAGQEINPADNIDTDIDALVPAPDLGVFKQLLTPAPVVAGRSIGWQIDFSNAGLSDAALAQMLDQAPVFPADPGGILAGSGLYSCQANAPLSAASGFGTPAALSAIEVGPQGRYVYAVSPDLAALLVFEIQPDQSLAVPWVIADGDPVDGNAADPDTVTGLAGAAAISVSADGLNVYVGGTDADSVVAFGRQSLAAPLRYGQTFTTVVPPTTDSVAGLRGARSVVVSPDQRHVFVAGSESNAIAVFGRDPDDGRLNFINRVADGIGTIVPEFNVIQGVAKLHASSVGGDLYAIATGSEALTRFSFNAEAGVLTFESVWRQGDGLIPDLAGLRDLVAAPGDTHLYLLVDAGIAVFRRLADGGLAFDGLFDGLPDAADARALVVDGSGSRAYLLADSADGPVIHMLRRDWADGSLEFWFSQPVDGDVPAALSQSLATRQLYLAAAPDRLLRFNEQALSRCLLPSANVDAIAADVDLGASGWSRFDFSALVHPSARGVIANTAEVLPSAGIDPQPGNNSASVSAPIEVVSDIRISKSGPLQAIAGAPISYQITVGNSGPSDALGIGVTDVVPAQLEQIAWTCSATPGSDCPASGVGAPDFQATVLANGELVVTLNAVIDSSFIGEIINVAFLTPEPGATDPTPGDQRDEVSTEVVAVADVALTKTTLTAPVVAGLPIEYRLEAINNGPSDAPMVRLVDPVPSRLTNVAWTCTGSGGAACPAAAGSGSIDLIASLPAGSAVDIRLSAEVSPGAVNPLVNRFTVQVQAPASDPDSANNLAEVIDPVEVIADVAMDLVEVLDPFDPAGPLDLPVTAILSNFGPSNARNVEMLIDVSANITLTSPGCTQPAADRIRCLVSQLDPGGVRVLNLTLSDLPAAPSTLLMDGAATVSAFDPDLSNNSDSLAIDLLNGVDLDVRVDNGRDWVSPDQPLQYWVEIDNIGSVGAPMVDVEVALPDELVDGQWTCTAVGGANCGQSGNGGISDAAALPSGSSVVYTLTARVDPALDLSGPPRSVTVTALVDPSPPEDDINPLNNLAVDQDEIRLVFFSDGFETLTRVPEQSWTLDPAASECVEAMVSADVIRTMEQGRLLTGHTRGDRPLVWVDLQTRGAESWLRMSAIGPRRLDSSGWLAWPMSRPAAQIRLERQRASLELGADIAWAAPVELAARVQRLSRPAMQSQRTIAPLGAPGLCADSSQSGVTQLSNGANE